MFECLKAVQHVLIWGEAFSKLDGDYSISPSTETSRDQLELWVIYSSFQVSLSAFR